MGDVSMSVFAYLWVVPLVMAIAIVLSCCVEITR